MWVFKLRVFPGKLLYKLGFNYTTKSVQYCFLLLLMYIEVGSNEPLSRFCVHIVSSQIKLSLIRGILIDMFKLFQMHYVFLFYLVRKLRKYTFNHVINFSSIGSYTMNVYNNVHRHTQCSYTISYIVIHNERIQYRT